MMSLEECYALFGGDYKDVKSRLRSDALIQRFAVKFLADPSYETLCTALKEKQYEEAFRAAHTIKGVAMNLSFSRLAASSEQLTELLRGAEEKGVDQEQCRKRFDQVTCDYQKVIRAVQKLVSESA